MLYILLYMVSTRTQIYLTRQQRRNLDSRRRREGKTLAAVVRDAVDAYLSRPGPDALGVEEPIDTMPDVEAPSGGWTWLVQRPHPWRRQLWVKGRRIRAADVVGHMHANAWDPEETARQLHLPVEAVLESRRYVESNADLIDAELIEEQRIVKHAVTLAPPAGTGAPAR